MLMIRHAMQFRGSTIYIFSLWIPSTFTDWLFFKTIILFIEYLLIRWHRHGHTNKGAIRTIHKHILQLHTKLHWHSKRCHVCFSTWHNFIIEVFVLPNFLAIQFLLPIGAHRISLTMKYTLTFLSSIFFFNSVYYFGCFFTPTTV